MIESVGVIAKEVVKKGAEMIIKSGEVAELGAIKPEGFGMLIKDRISDIIPREFTEGLNFSENPLIKGLSEIFKAPKETENPYLSIRYNEVAKESAEYLFDYGITPWGWNQADIEGKKNMIETATRIISEEMGLPGEWVNEIKPVFVEEGRDEGSALVKVALLENGALKIEGNPIFKINERCFDKDFYDVMETIYHEMVHMKQYASIDGVVPETTTDHRLTDVIESIVQSVKEKGDGSYVEYISSPHESESWAQGLYFKEVLKAVMNERLTEIYNL